MQELNEHTIVKLIASDEQAAWPSLDFMLNGAFNSGGYLTGVRKSGIEGLFVAPEVSRNELNLEPNMIPGDIDLLVIPYKANRKLYHKAMAVEVKVVKPTLIKPSRNANSLGKRQVEGLANDGFPYVGLLHIVMPEPLPEHLFTTLPLLKAGVHSSELFNAEGNPKFTHKADLFPIFGANRQFGRMKKLDLPEYVGTSSFGVSFRMLDGRWRVSSYNIQTNQTYPSRNPNTSLQTLKLIKEHYKKYANRYAKISTFA